MMRLKFSIEDILKEDKGSHIEDGQSEQLRVVAKKLSTSDGESTRSESPDSTTSTEFEEHGGKCGRRNRSRTLIHTWQKRLLEMTFLQQRYPSIQYLEKLSKELGLPNYVTKVWFQNRRSKFRKEGTFESAPAQRPAPYLIKSKSTKRKIANENTTELTDIPLSKSLALLPVAECNCDECLTKTGADNKTMPVLISNETCSCEHCTHRQIMQQQQHHRIQHQPLFREAEQWKQQQPQQQQQQLKRRPTSESCECPNCIAEDSRLSNERFQEAARDQAWIPAAGFEDTKYIHEQKQFKKSEGNTFHYKADPETIKVRPRVNEPFSQESNNRSCSCFECIFGVTYFRY